jgi:hypothetical protein
MIAVCSPRVPRWRSMQFAATFSVPSSNHLIDTLPRSKFTSLTVENGLIQSTRPASADQNPDGSETDAAYICS